MTFKYKNMINITKEFKKGEYYKTYMLLLNIRYDFEKNIWIYNTYIKQNERDPWVKNKCDSRTIAPFIDELIKNKLTDLKLSDRIEETVSE